MLVRIKYLHPNYGKVTQIFNVRDEDELTELIIKLETPEPR